MAKRKRKKEKDREERIAKEIIVDAYGLEEQVMGWYYYLEQKLQFPFKANCIEERAVSPLEVGQEVEVIGMPSEDECKKEIFITIFYGKKGLAIPLSQLRVVDTSSEKNTEAVDDWHYWVAMGYEFG